jgi:hypothetical protein
MEITYSWLDTPYVTAWFRMMAIHHPELAQMVYSWEQWKD